MLEQNTVEHGAFYQRKSADCRAVIQLRTDGGGAYARVGYLKFEVTNAVSSIVGATLHVYSKTATSVVDALAVNDNSWSEDTLTWDNRPTTGSGIGSGQHLDDHRGLAAADVHVE